VINAHSSMVNDLTLSKNNLLACASDDGTVSVWVQEKVAKEYNLSKTAQFYHI